MNIDKAIEILKDTPILTTGQEAPAYHKAVRLGIEALKRVEGMRPMGTQAIIHLLPGETKD